jgi:quercetin dioxygenase-like cupin family protein
MDVFFLRGHPRSSAYNPEGVGKMTESEFGAGSISLASLVDYQDGSIVSRTLLKRTAGNVTLFAFDGGQELSEHTTPHDALLMCVEGSLWAYIQDEQHRLSVGDLILLPANVPHAVRAAERFKMLLIMIRE